MDPSWFIGLSPDSSFPVLRLTGLVAFLALIALVSSGAAWSNPLRPDEDAADSLTQALEDLRAGRLDRAELLLERALMLQPENAEARVELALLMARRGQVDAARSLLQGLVDDPRTPQDHRRRLLALVNVVSEMQLQTAGGLSRLPSTAEARDKAAPGVLAQRPAPLWRTEATVSWSTNPLARTGLTDITLTTPEGPVQVPLASRPQSAAVAGIAFSRVEGLQGFELATVRADLRDAQTALRLGAWGPVPQQFAPLTMTWNLQAQQGFDGARRWMAGVTSSSRAWRGSVFHYREPSSEDSGFVLRAEGLVVDRPAAAVSVHVERSESTQRDAGSWRAGTSAQFRPAPGWHVQAQFQAQKDLQGYSPLLDAGAARWLTTSSLTLERTLPLASEKTLTFRALAAQRRSNIVIFAFREASLQVQYAHSWR